ncbi:hypothetical protein GOP47_0008136 [Adiantum capillus-veneris]|uniref:Uncharacterized protein n=1 Tax=Adiantum capillus-veneris TaxID=13818 RepID=A0A9D4UY82_ADICA|nr:hypothetical protein GOP47_0008136 [Adiantum capillus-veneris]
MVGLCVISLGVGLVIQPVDLPLLCDTGDIVEKLYNSNSQDRFLVSRTIPLVPTWNEMRLDLIETNTTHAQESFLDHGTFFATLRGEDLSDVVNVCGDASFTLERILYLEIYGEFWRSDNESDPE